MLIEQSAYGHRVVPIVFHTELHPDAFLLALRDVVGRHEALRFRYAADDSYVILDPDDCLPDPATLFSDLAPETDIERRRRVAVLVRDLKNNVPDLRQGPSWTVRCVRVRPDRFDVLLSLQHIDFDGTGLTVLQQELRDAYHARRHGRNPRLPAVVGYSEFTEWQASEADRQPQRVRLEFFRGIFASVPTTTALDAHHGFTQTRALPSRRFTPNFELSGARLRQAASKARVSPFALVLGAYATTVHELVGEPLVISAISSGRVDDRFARTIGPFTAPVPIPLHPSGCDPDQMAQQAHTVATAVTGRAAGIAVTDVLGAVSCFDGHPLDTYFSDIAINFTNYRRVEETGTPFDVEVVEILGEVTDEVFRNAEFGKLSRVPGLHLVFDASGELCQPNFWYHQERFSQDWVEAVANRFCDLVRCHIAQLLS